MPSFCQVRELLAEDDAYLGAHGATLVRSRQTGWTGPPRLLHRPEQVRLGRWEGERFPIVALLRHGTGRAPGRPKRAGRPAPRRTATTLALGASGSRWSRARFDGESGWPRPRVLPGPARWAVRQLLGHQWHQLDASDGSSRCGGAPVGSLPPGRELRSPSITARSTPRSRRLPRKMASWPGASPNGRLVPQVPSRL